MSSKTNKRPPLGKGLGALLQSSATDITSSDISDKSVLGSIAMLPISSIEANPFNPRTHFEEDALKELSESIGEHGIIQPLTVRKLGRDKYQLISGERRFRASQIAGLTEVPAYIRVANDQTMLEMALVENIQREDLNAIEVALSYQRLLDECSLTQEELSQKIAKNRSSITNHLRLLKLPALVQKGVRDSLISMGHARALVSAGEETKQIDLYYKIIEDGLSVRALENILKNKKEVKSSSKNTSKVVEISNIQNNFKEYLGEKVAAKVEISKSKQGNGKLIINFNSETDLNRIIEILNK